jgi:hypothetical protein
VSHRNAIRRTSSNCASLNLIAEKENIEKIRTNKTEKEKKENSSDTFPSPSLSAISGRAHAARSRNSRTAGS